MSTRFIDRRDPATWGWKGFRNSCESSRETRKGDTFGGLGVDISRAIQSRPPVSSTTDALFFWPTH
jgi:hypothetical protein